MAGPTESDLSLDTRWRSFWRHLTRRWSYVRREARAQTLGMLVIVLVLLTTSAICARTAYLLFLYYSQAVQTQLESAVARGEPRADIEFPAVTAAVLAPVNSHLDQWDWATIAPNDARVANQLLSVAGELMSAGLSLAHDRAVVGSTRRSRRALARITDADIEFMLSRIDPVLRERAPGGWADSVAAHTRLLCAGDTGFVTPLVPESTKASHRQFAQGMIATQRTTRALSQAALTRLLVPSTYVITPAPRRTDPTWTDITTAAIASLYLEDAMRLCLPASVLNGSWDDSATSIVQIYFISERSVLRIFPARETWELPNNRYWAAAHYFQRFYQPPAAGESQYESPPYIDIGDQGVVRTLGRLVPSFNRPDSSGVFGILYVDYKLPERRFLDALARDNVLFDLRVLRLTEPGTLRELQPGGSYTLEEARFSPARKAIPRQPLWSPVENADLVRSVATYAAGLPPGAENHTLGQFGGHKRPTFILPLGARPMHTFLIVSPRSPHMPWDVYVYGLLATALLVVGASMLINWRGIARLQLQRFEHQTFRRNMPVGVVRLDHRDMVLDANQIAEWGLGTTLQQEGEQGESDSERRRFATLIEPRILMIAGLNGDGTPIDPRVMKYSVHLQRAREWPMGCTYMAVAKHTPAGVPPGSYAGRVLQVSEAPLIGEPPGRRRGQAAADLGESTMVPKTDLIIISVIDEKLAAQTRKDLREAPDTEDRG